jgi:hypothetical protein
MPRRVILGVMDRRRSQVQVRVVMALVGVQLGRSAPTGLAAEADDGNGLHQRN